MALVGHWQSGLRSGFWGVLIVLGTGRETSCCVEDKKDYLMGCFHVSARVGDNGWFLAYSLQEAESRDRPNGPGIAWTGLDRPGPAWAMQARLDMSGTLSRLFRHLQNIKALLSALIWLDYRQYYTLTASLTAGIADKQMRERFEDLGDRVHIASLYGMSSLRTKVCFYKYDKDTGDLWPRVIRIGWSIQHLQVVGTWISWLQREKTNFGKSWLKIWIVSWVPAV